MNKMLENNSIRMNESSLIEFVTMRSLIQLDHITLFVGTSEMNIKLIFDKITSYCKKISEYIGKYVCVDAVLFFGYENETTFKFSNGSQIVFRNNIKSFIGMKSNVNVYYEPVDEQLVSYTLPFVSQLPKENELPNRIIICDEFINN